MENNKWLRSAYAAGLSMLLSISSITCLLTTFDLNASIGTVLLWCMIWSVAFSVGYALRWQLLPVGIMAVLAGYLLRSGALYNSFGGLLYKLTKEYNLVHGWNVLGKRGSVDLILCAVGALTALFVSRAVSGRKSSFPGIFFALLPLLCCVPVSDAAPQPVWLGLWMLGLGLLIMTGKNQSNRLVPMVALPLAALSLALLVAMPLEKQESPRAFAQSVTQLLEDIGIGAAPGKGIKTDGGAVELNKLGSRKESGRLVMTVISDRGGTLYLRGCAYDTYFRNNWTNLSVLDELYWPDEDLLEEAGQVHIQTEYRLDMRYFPYYTQQLDDVNRGINNYSGSKEYSYQAYSLKERPQTYTSRPEDGYTQLPTVTDRWTEKVLAELITEDMTDSQKIAAITNYVKACAKYNLYVDKMPAGEQDFVIWFAESAGKGYCVHFATAATVLLRGAGIPARYVTGYMVQTQAGVPTQVYGKDAHAWAECFIEGVGWVPVEATPGAAITQAPQELTPQKTELPVESVLYVSAAVFVITAVGFVLQWLIRVYLLYRKRKTGNTRQRLLACYGQLERLLELAQQQPEEVLTDLAQRAKYSPHPVEEAQTQQMEQALKKAKKLLKQQPLMKKLHHRFILGLY